MTQHSNITVANHEPRTGLWNLTKGDAFLLLLFSGQLCGLATSTLIKVITASAKYSDLRVSLKTAQTLTLIPGGICEIGLIILILGSTKRPEKFTGNCLRATPYIAIAYLVMTWTALVAVNFWPDEATARQGEAELNAPEERTCRGNQHGAIEGHGPKN